MLYVKIIIEIRIFIYRYNLNTHEGQDMRDITDYGTLMDYDSFEPKEYPVRHKRKVPFRPYPMLPFGYRERISKINDLDRTLDSYILGSEDYFELVVEAYSSNTHWSTKIEGNPLSEDEVYRLTRRFTSGQLKEKTNGPSQEILNHMYPLFKRWDTAEWDLPFSNMIHSLLMKDTGYSGDPNAVRKEEVSVYGGDGFEYFIACPPAHISCEMGSLFAWLNGSPYEPVCTASLFFHEYESIHPYMDGNGRTGRMLFQMLLQKLGLKYCGLCKFEQQLLKNTERFYTLMAYTDESGDYAPFVSYVTDSLVNAYEEAVMAFGRKDRLKDADEVTRTIARKAKKTRRFVTRDVEGWMPAYSRSTVRNRLSDLTDMGILRKEGNGRSTVYVFDDPFEQIRRTVEQTDTVPGRN